MYSLAGHTGSGSIGYTAVADMKKICRAGVRQHYNSHKRTLVKSTTPHFGYSKHFFTSLHAVAFALVQQQQQSLQSCAGLRGQPVLHSLTWLYQWKFLPR